ncbi:aquaporin-12B [Leptonychotes weddellii]|uniref:Aquaporin-12B n=1 Tax=Leptonychotes weddellii TaxID=9713 RepID=A0A7F8PYG4_LEPWE|nr:aquaporin-12B [Leptonychotes weddellii]
MARVRPLQLAGRGARGPGVSHVPGRTPDRGASRSAPTPAAGASGGEGTGVGFAGQPAQVDSPTAAPSLGLGLGRALTCQLSSPARPRSSWSPQGLNVSLSFFATFALCQAARRVSKALLPAGTQTSFAREAVGVAQLGACCLEMRMLVELGPWAGAFGPNLLPTLLFLVHGATCDGAAANPTVSLQELLLAQASLPGTLLTLAAQGLGVQAACTLSRLHWAWELSDLHVLQSLMDAHCSSALRTSAPHGTRWKAPVCAFFFHLTLLRFRNSLPVYRVPVTALLVTVTAHTAGPFTSAFFNPTLATSVTFPCSGLTLLEYTQVYWLGPLTGPVLAVLRYHGRLPRLFQRNLLYNQKNKYRTPRGKRTPGPRDTHRLQRGLVLGLERTSEVNGILTPSLATSDFSHSLASPGDSGS